MREGGRGGGRFLRSGVDFSVFLILPFSAIVSCAWLLWTAGTGRARPRLIWPCAFSTLCAVVLFAGSPPAADGFLWIAALFIIAILAAAGTIIGAVVARLARRLPGLR